MIKFFLTFPQSIFERINLSHKFTKKKEKKEKIKKSKNIAWQNSVFKSVYPQKKEKKINIKIAVNQKKKDIFKFLCVLKVF